MFSLPFSIFYSEAGWSRATFYRQVEVRFTTTSQFLSNLFLLLRGENIHRKSRSAVTIILFWGRVGTAHFTDRWRCVHLHSTTLPWAVMPFAESVCES